jgi:hypothetical protein
LQKNDYLCIIKNKNNNLKIRAMKKIKVYTVEALEKQITKALKKVKFGYQEGNLIEATDAEFSIYNFNTALCNLQQKGVVAYNENTESYELV